MIFNENSIRIDKTRKVSHHRRAVTRRFRFVKALRESRSGRIRRLRIRPGGRNLRNAELPQKQPNHFFGKVVKDDQKTLELSNAEWVFFIGKRFEKEGKKGTIVSVIGVKNGDTIAIKEKMEQILARSRVIQIE